MYFGTQKAMLLFKYKIHRQYKEYAAHRMVPPESFVFEKQHRKNDENHQRDHFLDHLELHQRKRAAVAFKTNPVRGNLEAIFKQCQSPADQNNRDEPGIFEPFKFFEFEMAIPRQSHENIREQQQANGRKTFHAIF
jgi:hypothetical protein